MLTRTYWRIVQRLADLLDSYDRDLFPHWITISGACNTRETVLKRDGTVRLLALRDLLD